LELQALHLAREVPDLLLEVLDAQRQLGRIAAVLGHQHHLGRGRRGKGSIRQD
jgi:hypothetical protein